MLVVTPYYNKPTQEGLYRHYKAIDGAINIPIIIYNIPGRSVVDMSVATMARLFELPNIAGVKDATASPVRVSQQRLAMGERFNQLSGEDATALAFNAHGGHGCISVTSNVAPRLCADFQNACLACDFRRALELHDKLMPLHEALFVESSPAQSSTQPPASAFASPARACRSRRSRSRPRRLSTPPLRKWACSRAKPPRISYRQ